MPSVVATWWKFKRSLVKHNALCSEMFFFVFSTECFCPIPKSELKSRKGKSFYAWQKISVTKSTGTTENFEMQRAPVALTKEKEVEEVQDFFNNWAPHWVPMLLKNLH